MTAAVDYLDAVRRARQVEQLPLLEQDAVIVTLLHLYPRQREQLLTRLVQLRPESVAAALDEVDEHPLVAGEVAEFYTSFEARLAYHRTAAAIPQSYEAVVAAIAGIPEDCPSDQSEMLELDDAGGSEAVL